MARSSFCKADSPQCADVDGLDTETITIMSTVTMECVTFGREEWAALIAGAKKGEFDLQPLVVPPVPTVDELIRRADVLVETGR
jgi:hypothetical protein